MEEIMTAKQKRDSVKKNYDLIAKQYCEEFGNKYVFLYRNI